MLILFNFAHPVTPQMMIEKNIADSLFGVFFFMMSAGMFIFSPIWGTKIDRYGTKKIMVIAPLVYALGQFLFFFFSNPILMCSGRLISGIFSSAWIVGTTNYINVLSPPQQKVKNFGLHLVSTNLGGMVGQLTSGYIGLSSYVNSFVVQIICLVVLGIVCLLTLDNLHPDIKSKAKGSFIKGLQAIYNNGFLLLILSLVCFSTVSNIVKGMPSFFASDIVGFTTKQVGTLNSYISFVALITNLFIIKHFEQKMSFKFSYLIQGIMALIGSFLLVIVVINPQDNLQFTISYILSITIVAFASSMYLPFTQKRIINTKRFNEGEILGVLNSFNAIGMLFSSASMSLLYPISPQLPFITLLVFSLLAIVFHLLGSKYETTA